jgi:hypothetical protein
MLPERPQDAATTHELQAVALSGVNPPQPLPRPPPATPPAPHLATVDIPVEASTITSLHAQAASARHTRRPLTQYSRGRDLVMLLLQRYALADHITIDGTPS